MASVTVLMVQSWKARLFVQLLVDKTAKRLSGRLCIWYGKSDIPFYILAKVHEEKVRKINIVKHADLWKSPHAHVASSNTSKELWLSNVLSGHTTINSQLWKLGFAFSQSQHCYPQDVPCTLLIGIAQTYIPKAYVHLDFVGKVEIGLELDEGEHGPPIDLSLCYLLLTTLQETASENQGEGGKNLYFEARNGSFTPSLWTSDWVISIMRNSRRIIFIFKWLLVQNTDMQEKSRARLRELAPPRG